MKKYRFLCWILCLLLTLSLWGGIAARGADIQQTEPSTVETQATQPIQETIPQVDPSLDASVVSGCHTIDAQSPLRRDKVLKTGQAGLLYEINSDTIVYGWNMDTRFYPAGMVKLMTALVAIEQGELSQNVTITQQVLDQVPSDSVRIGLMAGETFTLEQLIDCMVIYSANDAAVVIAHHISGGEAAFVEKMNEKAKEIGCTATHYVNVHGIHDDDQYTTARDLARLVRYALGYDAFRKAISLTKLELPPAEDAGDRTVYTSNYMISQTISEGYYDRRVTGGKTSSNKDLKRSAVIIAEENGLSYISVVTDTEPEVEEESGRIITYNEFVETSALLDLGFGGYSVKQVLYGGQILDQFTVTNGANGVAVGPIQNTATVLPSEVGADQLTWRYQATGGVVNAPVEKGQVLDMLQLWYGSVCVAQTQLVAMNSAAVAAPKVNDQELAEEGVDTGGLTQALIVFGVILGVIVGIAAVLYIIRWIRTAALRAKRRRRRSERRRSR